MALPNAKMKINRNGVTFESNVDAVQYSLENLIRAALRDTAKFLRKRMIEQLKKSKYMKRLKRLGLSTQYWVRKRENDLQIGFKHDTWYGALSELGDKNQPKRGILRSTVTENISTIQEIQSQYLSALNEQNPDVEEINDEVGADES